LKVGWVVEKIERSLRRKVLTSEAIFEWRFIEDSPELALFVRKVLELLFVAANPNPCVLLESNRVTIRSIDLENHDVLTLNGHDLEGELDSRAQQFEKPILELLFANLLDRRSKGRADDIVTLVFNAPNKKGFGLACKRSRVGERRDVLSDLFGIWVPLQGCPDGGRHACRRDDGRACPSC
jgi:hypothetical protein